MFVFDSFSHSEREPINWLSIIFSDETKIMLGRNGKVYVWRKPDCLGQLDDFETTCRASVKFWGWITYYGVGTLVAIDGNMNTDKYISVLDDNLWPVVVRHFSDRPRIFQEDNAPCHVSFPNIQNNTSQVIGILYFSKSFLYLYL
jgi:hypothetical protein